MDNQCFLTPLQQKFLQILSDYEKDPKSLRIREECDQMEVVTSYFKLLLLEKGRLLQHGQANFAIIQLIDEEIGRLFMAPISMADIGILEECGREALRLADVPDAVSGESDDSLFSSGDDDVTLTESIRIPVEMYPTYNFIGRIIGPRGMTAKQLEKDTGCRIMIRGNHSNKTYGSALQKGDASQYSIDLPLRVIIETSGPRREATARISEALNVVNSLLIPPPDGRDELKRRQLVELAIMNGTYRPTTCSKTTDN